MFPTLKELSLLSITDSKSTVTPINVLGERVMQGVLEARRKVISRSQRSAGWGRKVSRKAET